MPTPKSHRLLPTASSLICQSVRDLSNEASEWMSKQSEVKEETLTDWFLYNLSKKVPVILYHQFNRSEEGKTTGADWEWEFVFSKFSSFKCRVQAKRLKTTDNYAALLYSRNNKLQIDRLLENAALYNLAAFYAFYSNEKNRGECRARTKGTGIFLAEANRVNKLFIQRKRRKLLPTHILRHSNPLSCLFCCQMMLAFDEDIEKVFRQYVGTFYSTYTDHQQLEANAEIGFGRPSEMIIRALDERVISEAWKEQMQSRYADVNALVVVDLREEKERNTSRTSRRFGL